MYLLDKIKYLVLFMLVSCSNNQALLQPASSVSLPSSYATNIKWEKPAYTINITAKETWNSLSKKVNFSSAILQRYNHTSVLKKGMMLKIPARKFYQVKNGETTLGIALKHGLSFSELVALNDLESPYSLTKGQKLKIIEAKIVINAQKDPQSSNIKIIWPVKGNVIQKFGKQENNKHNDSISIDGNTSEIRAAAPGTVAYTGNEVGSYGNLVIIKHENNWFSNYGNLGEILVNKGETIKTGQIIGEADNSLLYFGLRKGTNSVDPLKYLPKKN
jgi:lipoprotein NlpD